MMRARSSGFAKRFLSLLMVVVMLAAQLPTVALADEPTTDTPAADTPSAQSETGGTGTGGDEGGDTTGKTDTDTGTGGEGGGDTTGTGGDTAGKTDTDPDPDTGKTDGDEGGDEEKKEEGGESMLPVSHIVTLYVDSSVATVATDSNLVAAGTADTEYGTAYTFTYTADSATLPTLTAVKEHHEAKWYKITDGSVGTTEVTTVNTSDAGNKYVAQSKPETYTVTLHYENCTISSDLTSYTFGVGATLPEPTVTNEHYHFAGWYTDSGFSGESVTTIGTEEYGTKEYWAKVEVDTYGIIYYCGETELTLDSETYPSSYTYGEGVTSIPGLPDSYFEAGYEFKGWFSDNDCKTSVTSIGEDREGAVTLYAGEKAKDITLTFKDGKPTESTQTKTWTYGTTPSEDDLPTAPEWKDDDGNAVMEFKGWFNGATEWNKTVPTEDTTYTAKWTGKATLNLNGGTLTVGEETYDDENPYTFKYTYGTGADLAAYEPTRTDYKFLGWYPCNADGVIAEDAVNAEAIEATAVGAQYFAAKWQLNNDLYEVKAGDKKLEVTDGNTAWTNAETVTISPASPATKLLTVDEETGKYTEEKEALSVTGGTTAENENKVSFVLSDETVTSDAEKPVTVNVRIDQTAPKVSFSYADTRTEEAISPKESGVYESSAGVIVTITVTDNNPLPNGWQDIAAATLSKVDGETGTNRSISWQEPTTDESGSKVVGTVNIPASDLEKGKGYYLTLSGIADVAGNTPGDDTTKTATFCYSGEMPTVTVKNVTESLDDSVKYYRDTETGNEFYSGSYNVSVKVESDAAVYTVSPSTDGKGIAVSGGEATNASHTTDNKTWTATVLVSGAGEHTIVVSISDKWGRSDSDSASAYIDTTAPTPVSPTPDGMTAFKQDYAAEATFTDGEGSGVKSVGYYIVADEGYDTGVLQIVSGESKTAYTNGSVDSSSASLTITAYNAVFKGKLHFYAVDNVGNSGKATESASGSEIVVDLMIDTKAPDITINYAEDKSPSDGKTDISEAAWSNAAVTYSLKVEDDNLSIADGTLSGVTVSLKTGEADATPVGGVTWTVADDNKSATATYTVDATTEGKYQLQVEVTDTATNKASATTGDLTIDTTAPTVEYTYILASTADQDVKTAPNEVSKHFYANEPVLVTVKVTDANLKTTEDGEFDASSVTVKCNEEAKTDLTWTLDGTTATATLTVEEGTSTVCVQATDKANNTNTEDNGKSKPVTIDGSDPKIKIERNAAEGNFWNTYEGDTLVYLTGGQSDTVTVTVTESNDTFKLTGDDKLGDAKVCVFKNGNSTELSESELSAAGITVGDWKQDGEDWTCVVTFACTDKDHDGQYHITAAAYNATTTGFNEKNDETDGYSSKESDTYVVDNTSPVVAFDTYVGTESETVYYANRNTTLATDTTGYCAYSYDGTDALGVTIEVTDVNIDLSNQKTDSNKAVVQVFKGEEPVTSGWTLDTWSKSDGVWTNKVTFDSDAPQGEYVIKVTATDKSKNSNTPVESSTLVNDTTAPTVAAGEVTAVTSEKTADGKHNVHYSNSAISGSFTVEDNYGVKEITKKVVDKDGGEVTGTGVSLTETDGTVSFSISNDVGNGLYRVVIEATDYAGNVTTYTSDYYIIDTAAPTEAKISATGDVAGNFSEEKVNWWTQAWDKLKSVVFGDRFAKNQIALTFNAKDETSTDYSLIVTNGIYKIDYFVLEADEGTGIITPYTEKSALDAIDSWTATTTADTTAEGYTFTATGAETNDKKFVVYMRATDKAGNVAYFASDGMIVEDKAPSKEADKSAPSIRITMPNSNGVYAGSVGLTIDVLEWPAKTFSGLTASIAPSSADKNISFAGGTLTYDENYAVDGLQGKGTAYITASTSNTNFERSDTPITVTATDSSGNVGTVDTTVNIDNRTPTATISYDNNTVYNSKYFNAARVATITVSELNFDSSNTKITTTGSQSGWTQSDKTNTGAKNTATVSYTTDGDYTLSFQTTDLAGHTLYDNNVQYSGEAPREFTIDMTKPVANITFKDADGNTVPSGGYANSTVTATITVTEHNFDESSATNGIHITRDGETYHANVTWSHSGDTHTAIISFIEEEGALYTFDMSFVDLANNECEAFQKVSFYVDTMAPSIVVDDIAMNSANNADVIAPVVTVTDKYYDAKGVTVTLSGAKNGTVASAYTVSEVENGQKFTFSNIEKDDIYTLTVTAVDLAGNESTEMYVVESNADTERLVFSVNREGSTYGVDDDTKALLDGYYTNEAKDVVITVYNVDEIDSKDFVVTLTLGLINSRDLVEGEDYRIDKETITGGYMYTVTIFAETFDKDGAYTISVYTKDKAGNTSTNATADDEHGMELAFYLDTQAPSIVLNNLVKNERYDAAVYEEGSVSVSDQTLEQIKVELTYNKGKKNEETKTYVWTSEEINTADFSGTFLAKLAGDRAIASSNNKIYIRVEAVDKAGNVAYGPTIEDDNGVVTVDEDYRFTVSDNALVLFYYNKPLFFGSIGGLIVLAALITGLVLSRKKKKDKVAA